MTKNNPYTKVTNYDEDPNFEAITETIVNSHTHAIDTRTIYVKKGTYGGVAIPKRKPEFNLDLSDVEEAQAHADKIRKDLSGE